MRTARRYLLCRRCTEHCLDKKYQPGLPRNAAGAVDIKPRSYHGNERGSIGSRF
jgi:hypothetical protein